MRAWINRGGLGVTSQAGGVTSPFPLQISANGRYLTDTQGTPLFTLFDTLWSGAVQFTTQQMDTYLNDRQARGFNGFIVNLIEHFYSSQSPAYLNAYGVAPFTTMSPLNFSTMNEPYWQTVDYLLQGAKARNMIVIPFPAYLGFQTYEGFQNEIPADTNAHLQTYGAFLANRYGGYGNLIWGLLGDLTASQSLMDKQWNIVTGMRSVRTDQLIYAKPFRESGAQSTGSGYSILVTNGGSFAAGLARYPGFNINNTYLSLGDEAVASAFEYARSPAIPFFLDEDAYDGAGSPIHTPRDCRQQAYATYMGGGFAYAFGNNPIWIGGAPQSVNAFYTGGNPNAYNGPAAVLTSTFLNTVATQHMSFVRTLLTAYAWYKLVPQAFPNFVTSGRGSGQATICPALASDGTFGMVFSPNGGSFTVSMSSITHSGVRARWYDPTNGSYTTDAASPLANSGSHSFTSPASNSAGDPDFILVLD